MTDDARLVRLVALGTMASGVVAGAGFGLLRDYADELGGVAVWLAAAGSALGTTLVGLVLWLGGSRFWRLGTIWGVAALAVALGASVAARQPSAAVGAMLLSAVALSIVFLGRPVRPRALAGTLVLGFSALLVVQRAVQQRREPPLRGPAVVFEVARADDREDVFAAISTLPAGLRVAWGREPARPGAIMRSYVLRGPSFVTSADVVAAAAGAEDLGAYVNPTSTDEATARLRDVTRTHVGRRLSIMLDGIVQVAPLVASGSAQRHVRLALGRR